MRRPDRDGVLPVAVLLAWLAGAALSRRVGIWLGVGGVAVGLALALVALDRPRLRPLFTFARRPLALGLLVGAFMTLATYPLYPLLADLAPVLARDLDALYLRLGAAGAPWRVLALLPIVGAEELVWRGAVQSALTRRSGARPAVFVAAVLYALAHLPIGSPLLVAVAFACGLVWSALRAATGSLLAPLAAHALWDLAVLFVAPVR